MKRYSRVMLGRQSKHAEECLSQGFVGVDFGLDIDLTEKLYDNWRDFNAEFIPYIQQKRPDKTKVAAGLNCGMTWTLCKGLEIGDVVLSPDGSGDYRVGEITSDYQYHAGNILQHRRLVKWYDGKWKKEDMSTDLRNSCRSSGTMAEVTKYADEIEAHIAGNRPASIVATDSTIEDASVFALEKHLEDFLVKNWQQTELGKDYDIYEADGELVGQQYPSDTGPLDILAISKDKSTLLVVELKKGRVSDNVVGQIQRYMGFVKDELAETGQQVKGVIIGLEDDLRIKRALSVAQNIEFYRYHVNFNLFKA